MANLFSVVEGLAITKPSVMVGVCQGHMVNTATHSHVSRRV